MASFNLIDSVIDVFKVEHADIVEDISFGVCAPSTDAGWPVVAVTDALARVFCRSPEYLLGSSLRRLFRFASPEL